MFSNGNQSQINNLNECSTCSSWKIDFDISSSQNMNKLTSSEKKGLCIGGGFDGSYTQSNETCSMWKPLINMERILPMMGSCSARVQVIPTHESNYHSLRPPAVVSVMANFIPNVLKHILANDMPPQVTKTAGMKI